jgi:hypothetical protein
MWLKIFFFGLLFIAVTALFLRLTVVRRAAVLSTLIASGIMGGQVITWRPADLRPIAAVSRCVEAEGTMICSIHDLERYLPDLSKDVMSAGEDLRRLGVQPPPRVIVVGENSTGEGPGTAIVHISDIGALSDAPARRRAIINGLVVPTACDEPNGSDLSDQVLFMRGVVYGVTLKEFGMDDPGNYPSRIVAGLMGLDGAARRAWFGHVYALLWACQEHGLAWPKGFDGPQF